MQGIAPVVVLFTILGKGGRLMPGFNQLTAAAGEQLRLLTAPSYADITLLDPVRAPEGWGVFASVGPNFQHTIFGRDSIETAEDVIEYDQQLAHDVIIVMGKLQGTRYNPKTEEEVGQIIHEYRTTEFAGVPVPEHTLKIMHKLMLERGETPAETMSHYDTCDATPLYVRLIEKYTNLYGDGILSETFVNKDGDERNVLESVLSATNWIVGKLQQRDDRLLAYRRMNAGIPGDETNRGSIENQVWKDSRTSHLFSDGTLPDFSKDVVSVELQAYAYDALTYAARLFPAMSAGLSQLAAQVQRSTIDKLWMPEFQYFAQGLATHHTGEERLLDTLTSEGALLLDSKILIDLPDWARNMYVDGIENMILGPEFATPVGIRCRALRHVNLLSFVDYHGSLAVWPKDASDAARGFGNHRRDLGEIAIRQMIIDYFQSAGDFYELAYVKPDGTPYLDPLQAVAELSSSDMGEPLPVPEPGQAWSRSAAILSAYRLAQLAGSKIPFQKALQKVALALPRPRQPRVSLIPTFTQLLYSAQTAMRLRPRKKQ